MECSAPLRVLVVEDDGDDFFLVDELLRHEMDVRTEQAVSVEQALERIAGSTYDLLLLDYTLGARTGFDLLEELRRRDVGTPVIFLTGHGGEEIAVRALKAGAVDYISKARLNSATLGPAVRYALALGEKDAAVREARQALAAREREYRMLFENANDAIVIIDPETEIILEANPAACLLYECGREQLIGASLLEFSTDPAHGRAAVEQCLRAGTISNFETAHLTHSGRRLHLLANASMVEYRGRRAMMSGFRDISEQKYAEEKLRASEQRYRTLFERNLAGVFRATAEGELLEANESFVRMLGYASISELVSKKLPAMCTAAGFTEHWCAELASSGHLINYELRVLRHDGSTACLLANLVYLANTSGPDYMEGTVLDITERRHLEAQLLQSQKMEAIGQLAGGIAHDFNNLLMVIRSYAELVGETVKDNSVSKELDAILKAADRGAVLTRQLLTFGRKQIFTPRLVDINSVLENITKVLPRALGEDIRVETSTARDLWQVKADPVQIEQLVLNLAVNARDAMPGGGRLTLETANVVLDSDYVKMHAGVTPGEYVQLSVSDTGNGIPPEVLPRIFEPFFTTKARGKGTGLGLPTVYGIVQQSGGFIWVYSEPGEGTVFKVYLPRAGAAVSVDPTVDLKQAPPPGAETILLVEDEEAVRCAARTYLGKRGYRVLEADCGEAALRLSGEMRESKIDLLITDAVMPGMNGGVLGRRMLTERPGIRIIYVSGYTEATMGERGVDSSATFLQKPFSLAALARKVREVLDAPCPGKSELVEPPVEHPCVA